MKDSQNRTKKQLLKRVWDWIKISSLLLGIFCGGVLIYQWWERKQEINFTSTNDLVNSSRIHSFFSCLLNKYAKKFAKIKELDTSQLPLKFAGFY